MVSPFAMTPRTTGGFSLIELLIALAVLSLLTALALPPFFDAIRKSRRADAVAALSAVQQAQERWRANNPAYADSLSVLGLSSQSPSGHYTVGVSNPSATGFTATATAAEGSSQVKDADCRAMQVVLAGGNLSYQARCASCDAFNAQDPARCWKR